MNDAEWNDEDMASGARCDSGVCPACGGRGSRVAQVTLHSLLEDEAAARLDERAQYWFCKTADCEVVYFRCDSREYFSTSDLRVTVFEKSSDPSRLVCYCFDHSVEEIQTEVARTGCSAIADEISEKCRRGLDRCEETNPRGSCCLGNVRRIAKEAAGDLAGTGTDDGGCCCCAQESEH